MIDILFFLIDNHKIMNFQFKRCEKERMCLVGSIIIKKRAPLIKKNNVLHDKIMNFQFKRCEKERMCLVGSIIIKKRAPLIKKNNVLHEKPDRERQGWSS